VSQQGIGSRAQVAEPSLEQMQASSTDVGVERHAPDQPCSWSRLLQAHGGTDPATQHSAGVCGSTAAASRVPEFATDVLPGAQRHAARRACVAAWCTHDVRMTAAQQCRWLSCLLAAGSRPKVCRGHARCCADSSQPMRAKGKGCLTPSCCTSAQRNSASQLFPAASAAPDLHCSHVHVHKAASSPDTSRSADMALTYHGPGTMWCTMVHERVHRVCVHRADTTSEDRREALSAGAG
jgi:hypothetical protein